MPGDGTAVPSSQSPHPSRCCGRRYIAVRTQRPRNERVAQAQPAIDRCHVLYRFFPALPCRVVDIPAGILADYPAEFRDPELCRAAKPDHVHGSPKAIANAPPVQGDLSDLPGFGSIPPKIIKKLVSKEYVDIWERLPET